VSFKRHKIKIAMFGSLYWGYAVLSELLKGSMSEMVEVVGVVTDPASSNLAIDQGGLWQYPHTALEAKMVNILASSAAIEVYQSRVDSDGFYSLLTEKWEPDLCVMATFGKKIDTRLINFPPLGFYNLHPCIQDSWPTHYASENSLEKLIEDKKEYAIVAMHALDEKINHGPLLATSDKIYIPPGSSVVDAYKLLSAPAAKLAANEMIKIIQREMVS